MTRVVLASCDGLTSSPIAVPHDVSPVKSGSAPDVALAGSGPVEGRSAARNKIWAQIDRRTMQNAVILPGVYARSLLYRNPDLTNVYVNRYYAMYDYANLGLK